jgi:hypothetical protein
VSLLGDNYTYTFFKMPFSEYKNLSAAKFADSSGFIRWLLERFGARELITRKRLE